MDRYINDLKDITAIPLRGRRGGARTAYAKHELDYIKDNFGKMTSGQIAKNIARSKHGVLQKMHKMGLKKRNAAARMVMVNPVGGNVERKEAAKKRKRETVGSAHIHVKQTKGKPANNKKSWSPEEDKYVLRTVRRLENGRLVHATVKAACAHLARTPDAVISRVTVLDRLVVNKKGWLRRLAAWIW